LGVKDKNIFKKFPSASAGQCGASQSQACRPEEGDVKYLCHDAESLYVKP